MFFSAIILMTSLALPTVSFADKARNESVVSQEVKYQEIKADEIPKAITESFSKDFSGYSIDKAFKGDDGTYKLEVSKDAVPYVLHYNVDGVLLKVEKPEDSGK